jgi:hypothetical protein
MKGACGSSFVMRKASAFTSDRFGRGRGYDPRRFF